MNKINFYIHIGLNKTGSSTLQNFLRENSNWLRTKGYLYPKSGLNESPLLENVILSSGENNIGFAHHRLFHQIHNSKQKSSYNAWQDLFEEIKTEGLTNVILSSETFRTCKLPALRRMYSVLQQHPSNVKIVVYLRRQDLLMQSMYSQRVKTGAFKGTFPEFIERAKLFPLLNYSQLLRLWKEVFGIENIIVCPFEKKQMHDGNLINDFLITIDKELSGSIPTEIDNINLSPGYKTLTILRHINHFMENKSQTSSEIRERYLHPILNYSVTNSWNEEEPKLLTYEDSINILEDFEESNSIIAREYLGRENGKLFVEEVKNEVTKELDMETFTNKEMLDITLTLLDQLWQEHRKK